MEAKPKAGKTDIDGRPTLPEHLQRILDQINSAPRARDALKTLRNNGCHEMAILHNLFLYCGGTESQIRAGLKDALAFSNDLSQLAKRLVEDAQSSKRILYKINAFHLLRIDVPAFSEFTSVLESRADLFRKLSQILQRNLGNIRIGAKGKGKGRVNLTAGRVKHLLYLTYLVSGRNIPRGRHFELITPLVKAVSGDERPPMNIKDSLRNAVVGFGKKFPQQTVMLREEARAEHYEWKNKSKKKILA